jgi:hypothetical protein
MSGGCIYTFPNPCFYRWEMTGHVYPPKEGE